MLILGLVFFPPIGIIMLWAGRKDWGKKTKGLLTVLSALWFVMILTSGGDSNTSNASPPDSQPSMLEAVSEAEITASMSPATTPKPSITAAVTVHPSEDPVPASTPAPTPIPTPAPTVTPTPEPTPSNLFLQAKVHTTSDSTGGTRAYIFFDPADMTSVSEPDYKEFCDTVVADAKNNGYSHFTVDFQNGTGIVYPGCSAAMADYAYLDDNGQTGTLIYSISYQNGSITYITPTPEPTPTPTPTPEPVSEPVGTTVYITNTGSKYHRDGCQYLSKSQISISLSDAKSQGYEPCKKCHPPT